MTRKTRICFACAAGITVASASAASADVPTDPTDPTAPIETAPPPMPTDVPAPPPATTPIATPPPIDAPTTVYTTAPVETPRHVVVVDPYSYAWSEPRMVSQFGVGLAVGGGVTGFTDHTLRDTTSNVGGLWNFHATLGTHVPIGLDFSYVGSAANLSTLAGLDNGQLIGTTVEGAIRYNILPHLMVDPYVFAGVGWQRYDVQNVRFAQADTGLKRSDSFAEFPMGGGLSWRDFSGLTIDVHGTYRRASDSTLVLDPTTGTYAALHSWEASGGVGYEF